MDYSEIGCSGTTASVLFADLEITRSPGCSESLADWGIGYREHCCDKAPPRCCHPDLFRDRPCIAPSVRLVHLEPSPPRAPPQRCQIGRASCRGAMRNAASAGGW